MTLSELKQKPVLILAAVIGAAIIVLCTWQFYRSQQYVSQDRLIQYFPKDSAVYIHVNDAGRLFQARPVRTVISECRCESLVEKLSLYPLSLGIVKSGTALVPLVAVQIPATEEKELRGMIEDRSWYVQEVARPFSSTVSLMATPDFRVLARVRAIIGFDEEGLSMDGDITSHLFKFKNVQSVGMVRPEALGALHSVSGVLQKPYLAVLAEAAGDTLVLSTDAAASAVTPRFPEGISVSAHLTGGLPRSFTSFGKTLDAAVRTWLGTYGITQQHLQALGSDISLTISSRGVSIEGKSSPASIPDLVHAVRAVVAKRFHDKRTFRLLDGGSATEVVPAEADVQTQDGDAGSRVFVLSTQGQERARVVTSSMGKYQILWGMQSKENSIVPVCGRGVAGDSMYLDTEFSRKLPVIGTIVDKIIINQSSNLDVEEITVCAQ